MQDNIFYIHTTSSIIDYITMLSKRYIPERRVFHILDESILFDIKERDMTSAQHKLENVIRGGLHSGARSFMITCTSTGKLIDNMDDELRSVITRIEEPAIREIARNSGKTGIVYTNPTVWPEMQIILRAAGIADDDFAPCYVPGAFESILSGDREKHDKLIADYIQVHREEIDSFMLAQVSICSAEERLGIFSDDQQIISMAELGVQNLRKDNHA